MSYTGDYKMVKMIWPKPDDSGMAYTDIETIKATMSEEELAEQEMMFDSTLRITEDNSMVTLIPIPDEVTDEEIQEAIDSGETVVDRCIYTEKKSVKLEDGNIYMEDPSCQLTGEPWVKINDVECEADELNLVLAIYKKIQ